MSAGIYYTLGLVQPGWSETKLRNVDSTVRLEPETIDPKVLDVNYLASKLSIGCYFNMGTTCFLISGICTLRWLFYNTGNKLRTQSCLFETCVAITVSPFLGVISHPRFRFRSIFNAVFRIDFIPHVSTDLWITKSRWKVIFLQRFANVLLLWN